MDYGIDTNRTFGLKELLIFTDYLEIPQTQYTRQCNVTAGQYPCLVKGCYTDQDICNGRNDCEDGFDESDCGDSATWQQVNISGNVLLWPPVFLIRKDLDSIVGSSGILKGKQKLCVTFNSDKLGGIDLTKFSKLSMCSAGAGRCWLVQWPGLPPRHYTWSVLKFL